MLHSASDLLSVYRPFADGHADGCGVIPPCIFDLHFSNSSHIEYMSHTYNSSHESEQSLGVDDG